MVNAISTTSLGKRYRLGELHKQNDSLRDVIARKLSFQHNSPPENQADNLFWALRDISFDIPEGQVTAVVGGNGAGKSTLLKLLSRVTSPTEGSVTIRGSMASLLEVGTGFHPELTGRENIYLNGSILGMSRKDISARIDAIVDFAEISQFIDTPVKRFSSGMYVRLAFAVAAHVNPDVLMIDEVLAVGDARFQQKCVEKMREAGAQGKTVLFVSHNMNLVSQLCSHSLMLANGRLIDYGRTNEIINRYMFDEPEGDLQFTLDENRIFSKAAILDDQKEKRLAFSYFDKIFVRTTLTLPDSDGFAVSVRISNDIGTSIFTSHHLDSLKIPFKGGTTHTLTCEIPAKMLRPGKYALELLFQKQLGNQKYRIIEDLKTVITISDIECPIPANRQGIIAPVLEWAEG